MAAPADSIRDLLGHLCAEIERQQAQIGEQSDQIDELLQENDRLRTELEESCGRRAGLLGCFSDEDRPDAHERQWRSRSEEPVGEALPVDERASVGCQTDDRQDIRMRNIDEKLRPGRCCQGYGDSSEADEAVRLHLCCCCRRSLNGAGREKCTGSDGRRERRDSDGVAHDDLPPLQPEPAPEPLQEPLAPATWAVRSSGADRCGEACRPTDEAELELLVLRSALEDSTDVADAGSRADASQRPDAELCADGEKAFGDTQQSDIGPQFSCSADSEAPVWTLSPTSFDSDASSPMLWMGLQTGSLESSPNPLERALFAGSVGGLSVQMASQAPATQQQRAPCETQDQPPSQHRQPQQPQQPPELQEQQLQHEPQQPANQTQSPRDGSHEERRPVLRRHPSSNVLPEGPLPATAAPEDCRGGRRCGEAASCNVDGGWPGDTCRLVRSILDALDAAQKRLQEGGRRRGDRRRGAAGAGMSGAPAQVDIRILVSSSTSSEAAAEVGVEPLAGSFMYILL